MSVTRIEFDPDKKSIKDIFEGSIQMVIPRYQRTFSWPKDKVDEFYDDFIVESEKAEDNLAYLGTILFSKDSDSVLEVIDGQQRLVTITIFFAAMRDLSKNFIATEKSKNFASGLQKLIVVESVFGNSFIDEQGEMAVKLRVGSDIESLFRKFIYFEGDNVEKYTARKTAERNVINAYNLFYSRVKKTIDHPKLTDDDKLKLVIRLVQKILSIEYIDIRVTDKEVAFNLFESHNAKGVALAKTDLIKNFYFGRIKGTDAEKTKKMDEWDGLLDNLDRSTSYMLPDRFFNYMIQSYDGHFPSSVLYRRIKPHIENPSYFYKQLSTNVDLMIELKSASTDDKAVNISLAGIEKMKVNQCFIFLLCLQRNKAYISPKYHRAIIELIENFTYLYSAISKQPTNVLEKVYSKHAKYLETICADIKKNKMADDSIQKERLGSTMIHKLKNDFVEIVPSYSVFVEGFSTLSYDNNSQKQLIRYTFERIEQHHSKGMVTLGALFTLDHIVPQSKTKGKVIYHSIGNLVPLSAADNSMKGSSSPLEKLDVYRVNSNFYSMQSVISETERKHDFDIDSISSRTSLLAKHAYENVFTVVG